MKLLTIIKSNEFFTYFIIGGIATIIDWSTFWFLTNKMNIHYEISLAIGYVTAGIFHYTSNKLFTFACQSKKIGSQYSVYLIVTIISLTCSMSVMAILVNYLGVEKLYARILTTILILIPNYLLHKHITFNKKIFLQPEAN